MNGEESAVIQPTGCESRSTAPRRIAAFRRSNEVAALLAQLGPDPLWSAEEKQLRSSEQPRDPWATAG